MPKYYVQVRPDDIYLLDRHVQVLIHLTILKVVETIWRIAGETFHCAQGYLWPGSSNDDSVFTRSLAAFKSIPRKAASM